MSLPNLVPRADLTGSLGTASKRWKELHAQTLYGDGSNITGITAEWDGSHNGNASITGSLTVTNGITGSSFTGSFVGDGSGLTNIITSSYAVTSSYALVAQTLLGSVVSASYAATSSYSLTSVTSSYALTASYIQGVNVDGQVSSALSSSYAATASYINGSLIKNGQIDGTTFTGNPKTTAITFTTPFPDNNYSITITGEDARTWTIESKVSGSFVINSNSNPALLGNVFWQAINFGEHNY